MAYYRGVKMSVREKQFRMNLDAIISEFINSRSDGYEGFEENLTADEWWEWVMFDVYDMKVIQPGFIRYCDGICKDLRFLGNVKMREIILEEARSNGLLEE